MMISKRGHKMFHKYAKTQYHKLFILVLLVRNVFKYNNNLELFGALFNNIVFELNNSKIQLIQK